MSVSLFLAAVVGLLLVPLPETPQVGVPGDFVVRNVDIVDVLTGTVHARRDIVVRAGRIESITPTGADQRSSAGLRVIDGSDQFAVPGLWDMHMHSLKISPQYQHPLLIANGVTGVREMWGCLAAPDTFVACRDDIARWTDALEAGGGLAPRYIIQSGFAINGDDKSVPSSAPEFFRARHADDVAKLVAFYAEAGVDSLKTYSNLSPAAYLELAQEANARGLMLAGHRPVRVSLAAMLAAGQASIEHPRVFLFECFRDAAAFRALPDPRAAYTAAMRTRFVDEHDAVLCASLMNTMAASETWWTPTLQVLRMSALAGDPGFRNDPRLSYIPFVFDFMVWGPDADRAADASVVAERNVNAELYALALDHVGQANATGVKLLAGTDAGDTYVFPGFSIHDELVELVAAGLTPAEALRAATIDAARFSDRAQDFGSLDEGKVADFLLLNDNPLDDIRNTRALSGLFFNGLYFDRAGLDRLLAYAENQAGSIHLNVHLLWDAVRSPIVWAVLAD